MTMDECGHNDQDLIDGRTVLCLECGHAFLEEVSA